jgi:hypothetical protein
MSEGPARLSKAAVSCCFGQDLRTEFGAGPLRKLVNPGVEGSLFDSLGAALSGWDFVIEDPVSPRDLTS